MIPNSYIVSKLLGKFSSHSHLRPFLIQYLDSDLAYYSHWECLEPKKTSPFCLECRFGENQLQIYIWQAKVNFEAIFFCKLTPKGPICNFGMIISDLYFFHLHLCYFFRSALFSKKIWPLGHRRDFCRWRLVLAGANQTFASHSEGQKTSRSNFVSSKLDIWNKI